MLLTLLFQAAKLIGPMLLIKTGLAKVCDGTKKLQGKGWSHRGKGGGYEILSDHDLEVYEEELVAMWKDNPADAARHVLGSGFVHWPESTIR